LRRALVFLGLLSACSGASPTSTADRDAGFEIPSGRDAGSEVAADRDAGPNEVADGGDAPDDAGVALDPFAELPDTSEGLTNVSADIEALLENGALDGACDRWEADPTDRRKKLMCGKSMFFYEDFDTGGVPAPLVDFATQNFPNEIGAGFERLGMVPDPYSTESRPLGLSPGPPLGSVESLVYTCAACHFGQLPDGRYAVGAANHRFEYGKQILAIAVMPQTVSPSFDPAEHHPAALAKVQPMVDRLEADRALRIRLLLELLPLLGQANQPTFTYEMEGWYASWPAGTMDFLIAPLPLDDGVHTVSKILPLWDLPEPAEQQAYGMPHAMLAWTGGAQSLESFLDGFVKIGGGPPEDWPPERLEPLRDYIFSLRSPEPLTPPDASAVRRGRDAFATHGCADCHSGPRGSGTTTYTFEEIGTDDAMMYWGDPELTGQPCCGLGDGSTELTHAIKSPRLAGIWAHGRFLHNGSLGSLDELFCLDGPRTSTTADALSTAGHEMTCDLARQDKVDLVAFLRSL
jgi:hypothetical protein